MDLAFGSLVILVFAIPGFVARSAYSKEGFNREALPRNITEDVIRALIYAFPFHLIGVGLLELAHHRLGLIPDINFTIVFRLLAGEYGKDGELFEPAVQNVYNHSVEIALYVLILTIAAFRVGAFLRKKVWEQYWDVRWPSLFGYRSEWVYLLFGRRMAARGGPRFLPHADVLVAHPEEKSRLYRGVILDFIADDKGSMTELILTKTRRGKFEMQPDGRVLFNWVPIPGTRFVIKNAEIKNLNITYQPLPS